MVDIAICPYGGCKPSFENIYVSYKDRNGKWQTRNR